MVSCPSLMENGSDAIADAKDNEPVDSMTTDSICSAVFLFDVNLEKSNRALAELINNIYVHVTREDFPVEMKVEEDWMRDYRRKLCVYYDMNGLGSSAVSEYVKTDSVLKEGERMIEKDPFDSTLATTYHLLALYTIAVFREYSLLAQMKEICGDEAIVVLLDKEWKAYRGVYEKALNVARSITETAYWGGSITGPACANIMNEMTRARVEAFRNIIYLVGGKISGKNEGGLKEAKMILLKRYSDTYDKTFKDIKDYIDEDATETSKEMFYDIDKETRRDLKELPALMDEWIAIWGELSKKLHDKSVECAMSSMLNEWVKIGTEDWCGEEE